MSLDMRKIHRFRTSCECVLFGSLLSIQTFRSIQWFCYRTGKVLIRLRGCAGWSGPLLSAYTWRHAVALACSITGDGCASASLQAPYMCSHQILSFQLLVYNQRDNVTAFKNPSALTLTTIWANLATTSLFIYTFMQHLMEVNSFC